MGGAIQARRFATMTLSAGNPELGGKLARLMYSHRAEKIKGPCRSIKREMLEALLACRHHFDEAVVDEAVVEHDPASGDVAVALRVQESVLFRDSR